MIRAGIYIHIPFCKSKCSYCDFYSVAGQENLMPPFTEALIHEIERCDVDTSAWQLDTLFFGGGTPSLLEAGQMEAIFRTLDSVLGLSKIEEITLEANPGEVSLEKLRFFRSLGINRLSLGGQSLDLHLLRFLTRWHSAEDVLDSIDKARRAGFTNLNCDLIFNIPGQSFKRWKRDLETMIQLDLEHLSCYSLTVEAGTPLHQQVKTGTVTMPDNDQSAEWYHWTRERLEQAGYSHYEISNWAKPGRECHQNLHYWCIEPYLGFGPSAHGFDGKYRYNNYRSVSRYIATIQAGQLPRERVQNHTILDLTNELVGFGLRTAEGVSLNRIPEPYKSRVKEKFQSRQEKWRRYCQVDSNHIRLTPEGFVFADEIAVDLML